MSNSSVLLIDEEPLLVLPGLAKAVGLDEAIVLQQVHYWLKKSKHLRDGRKWVYNTYSEWEEQFPFWTRRTIQRVFLSLETQGLLLSGEFNKFKGDRTKWYTIEYEILNKMVGTPVKRRTRKQILQERNSTPCGQNDEMGGQNDETHVDKMTRSRHGQNDALIPEITRDFITKTTNTKPVVVSEINPINGRVFSEVENTLGSLTPYLADQIALVLESCPPEWIIDACHEAQDANVRTWKYINGILKNWKKSGRTIKTNGTYPTPAPSTIVTDEHFKIVESYKQRKAGVTL